MILPPLAQTFTRADIAAHSFWLILEERRLQFKLSSRRIGCYSVPQCVWPCLAAVRETQLFSMIAMSNPLENSSALLTQTLCIERHDAVAAEQRG